MRNPRIPNQGRGEGTGWGGANNWEGFVAASREAKYSGLFYRLKIG